MNDLIKNLLSVKSEYDGFVEYPEMIQGYTEKEIKKIEQKYNLPIRGQFKEFLMTMGKHSGGLLSEEIYIYREGGEEYFTDEYRQSMNEIYDDEVDFGDFAQNIIKLFGKIDFEEKKFFIFANVNEHIHQYFMFANDDDDMVYEWDGNTDEIKKMGTLFEFLVQIRQWRGTNRKIDKHDKYFKELVTGILL
ncbi:SMI1/KNR4 family protein [Alysiella crassa]|uniref:SMI1 / KNR4 family n=1 Tax=Alysiella crassa TaxID=153491 RepID=A0A376BN13_9NEIS|nr:SMI1/KNR4 family protein [Alysiella crassa]UOP06823.1 SMI1/KNR4 family protein [Alysiella crassa]SSY71051.1 Uncharacterised protein [Alysiella crassa]